MTTVHALAVLVSLMRASAAGAEDARFRLGMRKSSWTT